MLEENTKPTNSQLLRQCIDWNTAYRIGTHVRYFPVLGQSDYSIQQTDGLAYILGDHTAVVRLRSKAGCFALTNLEPVDRQVFHQCGKFFPPQARGGSELCILEQGHAGPHHSITGVTLAQ